MFETNLFGSIEMMRAALPLLRERPGFRVVQFSSVGGLTARPGYGFYSGTKFAVEGVSEALAGEVAPLGGAVILVEPGAFRTDFLGRSMTAAKARIAAYDETAGATRSFSAANDGRQAGDPEKAMQVLLRAVDAQTPPLHLVLGRDAYDRVRAKLAALAADLDAWEEVATATGHAD